jgi:hypothetical protein
MQYKGDDMDLRVPQSRMPRETWAPAEYDPSFNNGRWRLPGSAPVQGEPLWVDEIVLACCNAAFDMALAHGSAEVGLEHLVHALTRVEAASRVLEARGVREGQLRRDSATLIASDVPTSLHAEKASPRRSADVEDVLRRAVELAGRRNAAASTDDLLWVLLHYGRDVPAIQLLRRLTPDWQRPDWGRSPAGMLQAPPRHPVMAAAPEPMPFAPGPGFDSVAQRLALIEDGMRTLHVEVATDRKALADLIRDVQRDIVANRSDAAALRSDLGQRLEALERSLQVRGDSARLTVQLSDRMQQLEKAVHNGLGEGARNWAALGQRLQSFEAQLSGQGVVEGGLTVVDRLGMLESAVDQRTTDVGRAVAGLVERLGTLERLAEAGTGERARRWTALTDRLGAIETRLASTPGDLPREAVEFTERFAGLERAVRAGFGDAARTSTMIVDRVGDLEKYVSAGPQIQDEAALLIEERLQGIERLIDTRWREQGNLATLVANRLEALETRLNGAGAAQGAIDFAVGAETMVERIGGVETPGGERALRLPAALAELATRVAALEQSVRTSVASADDLARARDREVAEMHDALIRLGENQHTLASAIADWRTENLDRLALVATQIERGAPVAEAAPVSVDTRLPNVIAAGDAVRTEVRGETRERPIAEREVPPELPPAAESEPVIVPQPRGRGFWWWLFGTDNVRRSNRESELRWERMRQRLQETRERRRGQA